MKSKTRNFKGERHKQCMYKEIPPPIFSSTTPPTLCFLISFTNLLSNFLINFITNFVAVVCMCVLNVNCW